MTHRILLLHRLDMPVAAQLAAQLQRDAPDGRAPSITVLDPVLHTFVCANGLPQAELLYLPGCEGDAAEAAARALAAARLVTAAADEVMAQFIPEARGAAWCTFWHRTLHTTAYGCRSMARALARVCADDTVHLLLPDQPLRYGYHSFVPGLMFNDALRAAGQVPRLYGNPQPALEPPRLPDPQTAGPSAVDLLCHIPTCFNDSALFSAELVASGRSVLVMPPPVFDVSTDGLPRCGLVAADLLAERLSPADRTALAATLDRLSGVLSQHLLPLIGGGGMAQKQVLAMVEGYRLNALLFHALQARFGDQPPKTLLISNHDIGLHGAFVSFALRHRLDIVMVPHAKIFNSVVPSYGHDVLCLAHPLQGGEIIDLDGYRMPTGVLDFARPLAVAPRAAQPLRTLGVVLNAVSAKALCLVDMPTYLQGLRQLRDWCRAHDIDCRIRCRPNGSIMPLICEALELPAEALLAYQDGSLVEFAQDCDLLLGYDVPTSGVFDLLDQGLPVLQVLCRRLEPEEARIVDARVVPQLPLAQALRRLDELVADPLALWRLRSTQVQQRVQAGAAAQPLRAWLQAAA